MKKNKSITRIVSIVVAVLLLLCGCKKEPSKSDTTATPTATLKWGIVKYNPYIKSINESSEILNFIKQKFNCSIEFEYYDSFNTKILKHMISNGTCPDILTMEAMSVEGQFLALNELVVPANEILKNCNHSIPEETQNFLSETEGTLYGIPGRYATEKQLSEESFGITEGVWVAQPYYDLLGRPEIRTIHDLISVSKLFVERYDDLHRTADIPYPARESDVEPIPIVLGNAGGGLETLKHLFGIYPVFEQEGVVKHSISSPQWNSLSSWLNEVSDLTLKSMSLSGKALDTALNGRSLFYIGSCSCINHINFESDNFRWEPISIDMSKNAYSVNPYGSCQSYIFKDSAHQKTVNDLISFLLSDEGTRLVKYGIENKHWIPTGDSFLQLDWVDERIETERSDFLNDIGIGQLLFFTTLENDNPKIPDVLATEKNAFFTIILNFTSGSSEALKLEKLVEYETDLCQRAATLDAERYPQKKSVIQSDIIHFPLYGEQYEINSLKERFEYWKNQNLKGTVS